MAKDHVHSPNTIQRQSKQLQIRVVCISLNIFDSDLQTVLFGFTAGGGEIINPKSLSLNEPSCEELRAMWRFSKVTFLKRQRRYS